MFKRPKTKTVDLLRHPLIRELTSLPLDRDDFVIFGSGPLLARGIRSEISDLDVVVRKSAWDRAVRISRPSTGDISGAPTRCLETPHGRIEFSQKWIFDGWDTEDLIARSEIIGGLRFAPVDDVERYKLMLIADEKLKRDKDEPDVAAIQEWRRAREQRGEAQPVESRATCVRPSFAG